MKEKVIIIGAGPAGLTAAYELLKEKPEKYEVIILEELDQIGGISKTIYYQGNKMDLGGHRFFSKSQKIMDFWEELLPLQGKDSYDDKKLGRIKSLTQNGPDPEKEDQVMLLRNRISRIYHFNCFFDYPITLSFETLKNMGIIRSIKAGFSYLKAVFLKKKENSLADFYKNRFGNYLYQIFFKDYTRKVWGKDPSEISSDWGKQRVKGLSISKVIKNAFQIRKHDQERETSLIEQFWYPKYGPGQLWEELARRVQNLGGQIIKNTKVIQIENKDKKIKSVTIKRDEREEKIIGDIIISSMPVKDLILSMKNEIPDNIKQIAQGLPYRDFLTIGLLVNKLNVENRTNIKTLRKHNSRLLALCSRNKSKNGKDTNF